MYINDKGLRVPTCRKDHRTIYAQRVKHYGSNRSRPPIDKSRFPGKPRKKSDVPFEKICNHSSQQEQFKV